MKSIIIIGSGAHSRVLINEIIKNKNYKIDGFLDEKKKPGQVINRKYKIKVIGNLSKINKLNNKNTYFFIGIGENFKREKIVNLLKRTIKSKIKWAKIISKHSLIAEDVIIGAGTLVVSGSIINPNTKIGKHCIINTRSIIEHDNSLSDFSSTGPSVVTGGNVKILKCSHIGIGSIIKNNIKINKNTIIGCKSFVNKDCKKNSIYFGTPAKKKNDRKYDQPYL